MQSIQASFLSAFGKCALTVIGLAQRVTLNLVEVVAFAEGGMRKIGAGAIMH